uniref:Methyltransferase n=1 Tax=viral metagenome TaxID=1070528 RepID=A0A6C0C4J3_9ZZZZ
MENILVNLNLINKNEIIIEHKGTRDISNINVKSNNNIKWLDIEQFKNYSEENLNEYLVGTDLKELNIKNIRKSTYNDDKRRYDFIKHRFEKKSKILDFGCGTGGFLHLIKNEYDVYGVEMSDNYRNILQKENLNIYKFIDDINIKFDCICLWHVFEHLDKPLEILKNISKKLKKNGKIYIEVPHSNDILINRYGCDEFKKFTYWSEHLILHTKKSLKTFIEAVNLNVKEIINIQRYNLINHLYWLSKGKPGGQKKWEDMNINMLNEQYKKVLIDNNETDTILAICELN